MSKIMETEPNKEPFHILVLDDEHSIRWVLERTLTQAGYIPHLATDAPEARQLLRKHAIRLALVDVNLPGLDGLSFTREILQEYPYLLIIVMTGQSTMYNTVEAMKAGAFDYVAKPFNIDEIEKLVKSALRVPLLTSESKGLKKVKVADDLLTGQSKVMRDLYKAIGRVAATDLTVLIQGESGTGKELIARSIYQHSLRADKSFVAINCAAIPSELMESELFGHEKGAFTGATERKRGKLEFASQGTLFLDEIGDMALATQTKILRALQEGEIQRVGSSETIKVDVRLLAATNKPLEEMVQEKTFREDLYYRLNVVRIQLPPLRQRMEDVPLLVDFVLKRLARDSKAGTKTISPEALSALSKYSWPGNVRELENLVYRSAVMAQSDTILLKDLPEELLAAVGCDMTTPVPSLGDETLSNIDDRAQNVGSIEVPHIEASAEQGLVGLPDQPFTEVYQQLRDAHGTNILEHAEREIIRLTLEEVGGKQVKAAEILGMTRATLRKRMDQYDLQK